MQNNFGYLKIVILSLVLSFVSVTVNAQKNNYIENNKAIATELSSQYGIPSAVILAIAFVESGAGSSKSSKIYNNHFGIVGNNNPNSKYKLFASTRESYEAFCKLITRKKYYTALKGTQDFSEWVKAIAASGYSTQPREWTRKINLIISKFGL